MTKLEEAALAYQAARDEVNRTSYVSLELARLGSPDAEADDAYDTARRVLERAHNALLVAAYGHGKVEA